jgi:hypothetical protein
MLAAQVLALRLATAATEQPRAVVRTAALTCVVLSEQDLRARAHLVACTEHATGQILGTVLSRRGKILCAIHGQVHGPCLTVDLCNKVVTQCP